MPGLRPTHADDSRSPVPQDASQLLYSLALMHHPGLSAAATQALLQRVLDSAASCRAQALSNSIWAAAQLGYSPPPDWMRAFCVALRLRLPSLNGQELANALVRGGSFMLAVMLPIPLWALFSAALLGQP